MRLRVVHVITRLELGGAQQNTLYCVRHHDRARFDVALVAGVGGMLDDDARAIPDATVDLVPYLRHPISPVGDARAVGRLAAAFRALAPDVVHTHSSKAGILGRLAAVRAGVRTIVHTVHGWSFNDTQDGLRRRVYAGLERHVAKRTTRLVCVARADVERGLALGIGDPGRYRVLRSGIELGAYRRAANVRAAARSAWGFGEDVTVVGTLANFKPQKAPLDFVRAAARALASDGSLAFVAAGDGPLRAEAERLARRSGIADRLRFLGWRRDAAEVLAGFDLFLLTSRFEGLPRSVLQAIDAGVPVVATAVDGTPEIVDDGRTGLLVPPGDVEAAADAVIRFARDPALARRCAEAARDRLGREFDLAAMVRELEKLYLDAADPTAGR